jgi:hypothetical protein
MIITINGRELAPGDVSGANLEEILSDIQERHLETNDMVSEVKLNGVTYTEDLPHASVEVERENIKTLELAVVSPEQVACHFLDHGDQLVSALIASLPHITEMFRLADEAEANEHFLRFLESLHLLISMLDRVGQVMGITFNAILNDQTSVNGQLKNLAATLTQLLDIQEQTDWIYLADLLEYELSPQLEALKTAIPQLRATVA